MKTVFRCGTCERITVFEGEIEKGSALIVCLVCNSQKNVNIASEPVDQNSHPKNWISVKEKMPNDD